MIKIKHVFLIIYVTSATSMYVVAQNSFPATGNVAIGTASPDQLLTINAPAGNNSVVSFKQGGTTKAYVGLGMDNIFRTQTLSGTELQLRADGASNFVSLYTNTMERMRILANGNVGIGTINPAGKLEIADGNTGDPTKYGSLQIVRAASPADNNFHISIIKYGFSVSGIGYVPNTNTMGIWSANNNSSTPLLALTPTQSVGIGTINPGSYKLAVEGTIGARKVKVTTTSWADYVFEKDYHLPSLAEVENYIQQHKHLPDVPSAAEVEKNGLDLGDNQAVLLKKIEELTLYIIEQDKQIQFLKGENKSLKEKTLSIEELQKEIEQIKKILVKS